jgi:hypothetical protein
MRMSQPITARPISEIRIVARNPRSKYPNAATRKVNPCLGFYCKAADTRWCASSTRGFALGRGSTMIRSIRSSMTGAMLLRCPNDHTAMAATEPESHRAPPFQLLHELLLVSLTRTASRLACKLGCNCPALSCSAFASECPLWVILRSQRSGA